MNEWGVAIAESSTTGRIVAPSDKGVYNSRPLFPIEELSRVALERCNTSRCAVRPLQLLQPLCCFAARVTPHWVL
jgi:hypothetical protein